MQKELDNWYTSWFNTPYYHTLYKDRDYEEAEQFMENLTQKLGLTPGDKILDLACGRGRHSIKLHKLGFRVTGVDLSPKSIQHAKQFETAGLEFIVHDMCEPLDRKFAAVFNLFTSFGYFEQEADNLRTIKAIKKELEPNGYGVIDFLNVPYSIANLVPKETKTVNGIEFNIQREYKNKYIYKHIAFTDNQNYNYTERVSALTLEDFKRMFNEVGVKLKYTFGNYSLASYKAYSSPRLILIFTI